MVQQKKANIIDEFKLSEGDTGSTEVQVALLTERITQLTGHMVANTHDYHTKRSLLKTRWSKKTATYLPKPGEYKPLPEPN